MAGQSQFINVLRGPTGPLSVDIAIKPINTVDPVTVITTINFSQKTDEQEAAHIICDALNSAFDEHNIFYGAFPAGSAQFEVVTGDPYQLMPRAWVCGHYVNVWAQAPFRLIVGNITPATQQSVNAQTRIVITDGPVYPTLSEAERIAKITGIRWDQSMISGEVFNEEDKVAMIIRASDELRSLIGWAMTAAQYLHEDTSFSTDGFFLEYTPIVVWDYPAYGSPNPSIITANLSGYNVFPTVDSETGFVTFGGYACGVYNTGIKMGYVGGYPTIDSIFKNESMRLLELALRPDLFSEMKGGSGAVKMITADDVRTQIRKRINAFLGRR